MPSSYHPHAHKFSDDDDDDDDDHDHDHDDHDDDHDVHDDDHHHDDFCISCYYSYYEPFYFSWGCYDGWRGGRTPEPRVYDVTRRYDDIHRLGQTMPLRVSQLSPTLSQE